MFVVHTRGYVSGCSASTWSYSACSRSGQTPLTRGHTQKLAESWPHLIVVLLHILLSCLSWLTLVPRTGLSASSCTPDHYVHTALAVAFSRGSAFGCTRDCTFCCGTRGSDSRATKTSLTTCAATRILTHDSDFTLIQQVFTTVLFFRPHN